MLDSERPDGALLAAEAAWNICYPERVAGAYTADSVWRNRGSFIVGRDQIVTFLRAKWKREFGYVLLLTSAHGVSA
jgi:uncharacterized protein